MDLLTAVGRRRGYHSQSAGRKARQHIKEKIRTGFAAPDLTVFTVTYERLRGAGWLRKPRGARLEDPDQVPGPDRGQFHVSRKNVLRSAVRADDINRAASAFV